MAYSTNPYLPKARKDTINLVIRDGLSVAQAARQMGVHRSTVWRWLRRWKELELHHHSFLPTNSSRPHSHPRQLSEAIIRRIVALREQWKRCAGYIHALLKREGIMVSLASVSRVLARHKLSSRWHGQQGKQRRRRMPRPKVAAPGSFLQMDTIHFADWKTRQRYYVYTLIDLKSRWTYAEYSDRISPERTNGFVLSALKHVPFKVALIQTDNGQEFGKACEKYLNAHGITQRRIRLGKKNDNAHIERFNRTIQDECLGRWPSEDGIQARLTAYLDFYNTVRLHSGIQYRTPAEVLQRF